MHGECVAPPKPDRKQSGPSTLCLYDAVFIIIEANAMSEYVQTHTPKNSSISSLRY